MTKQELLDFSAGHIDKLWTMEDHQRLVVGLRAVEQMAANHIRRALDEVENRRGASYHHSPVDPEAAEI